MYARVAVPVPLGRAFTYRVEPGLTLTRGARVLVEFGRRRVLGVVLELTDDPGEVPPERLKPVLALVEDEPALPPELLDFLLELGRYYLAPVGEVLRLALPALDREAQRDLAARGFEAHGVGQLVQFAEAVEPAPALDAPLRGARATALLARVRAGAVAVTELEAEKAGARAVLARLAERGLVRLVERPAPARDRFAATVARDVPPTPTPEQAAAVATLTAALDGVARGERPTACLLEGITGSGKTEVYLRAASHALALGLGTLVLVPEIALTPQLVGRFRARLGEGVAVLHSGLAEGERHRAWRRLRAGELRVAVGARSALFAPVERLGLVIVDEEHDGSFKQEEGVRYHARDMALLRAHRAGALGLLGTATPALGTAYLAATGRLTRLTLTARAHAEATLPVVEIVDRRRVGPAPGGDPLITISLFRALERTLAAGDQAILFLNRRGFAPSLQCETCGVAAECPDCDVALTLHRGRSAELRCHYCDRRFPVPARCAACQAPTLTEEGAGTERIEAAVQALFPAARVARLDRDVAAGVRSQAILERVRRREVDVLVGTQMVTKGHDLPGVTLVGVLNADAALTLPDFRAAERTFQLLVQVAGRAGRADRPGTVIVQTRQPEHPAIRLAAAHDVAGFARVELEARRELGYPPYSRLALVRLEAGDERVVAAEAQRLAQVARAAGSAEVVGPAPAPILRVKNRFRWRFLVRSPERAALRDALLAVLRADPERRVRVTVDVDPMTML